MIFRGAKDDVTALVLTRGESTIREAVNSLYHQTMPLRDIVMVRDVVPFHKAINAGAARVKTPFFVQVDADMILDAHCIAALRNAVRRDVGIVVGQLRDALIDQVVGVKLFRTQCFRTCSFRDSISPDTDFVDEIGRAGLKTVFIGRVTPNSNDLWTTFGEHRPSYTMPYTYRKHLLMGCRYRYRRSLDGFRWHFAQLGKSRHPSALIAQIGMSHGLFLEANQDLLGISWDDRIVSQLEKFLGSPEVAGRDDAPVLPPAGMTSEEAFRHCYQAGSALFDACDLPTFLRHVDTLNGADREGAAWIFSVALYRGLLTRLPDDRAIEVDYQTMLNFLNAGDRPLVRWTRLANIPSQHTVDPSRPGVPLLDDEFAVLSGKSQLDLRFDSIAAYAAEIGLARFAVDGRAAAEYRADRSSGRAVYRSTGRPVVMSVDPKGRPRIKVPFRFFGHLACTEPERIDGIFWCADLLKSGYAFVHVPTILGPKKMSVPGQLTKNCFGRLRERSETRLRWMGTAVHPPLQNLAKHRSPSYRPRTDRILMVASTLIQGGSERQMVATAAGLVKRGYDVRIMALDPLPRGMPSFEDEIAKLGIKPEFRSDFIIPCEAGFRSPRDAAADANLYGLPHWIAVRFVPIRMAILRHRPSVVHGWLDMPGIAGALAACALGTPRVVVGQRSMGIAHHGVKIPDLLRDGYRAVAGNPNVSILNNSAAGAADYEYWLGLPPGTIRVLYNGFMPDSVRVPAQQEVVRFREGLGLRPEAPVVGMVMRFVAQKDPDLWLDTAAEIARMRPDAQFLLAGFGPLQEAIERRIDALGLGGRVVLPGPMTDVGLIYAALDVVLLTSTVEGLPNVLIEAQGAGRPVVAPDVGGLREAVADGRTGRIARERSARGLAEAALEILADPTWATRARVEGPAFVASRFGLDRMMRQTLEIYGLPPQATPPTESAAQERDHVP